jgi:hypothetical protein
MGSAVEIPVPGSGGGRAAMSQRIRQTVVVLLPVVAFIAVFSDMARRWV